MTVSAAHAAHMPAAAICRLLRTPPRCLLRVTLRQHHLEVIIGTVATPSPSQNPPSTHRQQHLEVGINTLGHYLRVAWPRLADEVRHAAHNGGSVARGRLAGDSSREGREKRAIGVAQRQLQQGRLGAANIGLACAPAQRSPPTPPLFACLIAYVRAWGWGASWRLHINSRYRPAVACKVARVNGRGCWQCTWHWPRHDNGVPQAPEIGVEAPQVGGLHPQVSLRSRNDVKGGQVSPAW